MKQFILMMQFLTKYPLPFQLDVNEEDFTKGVVWFPVVGLIIGLTLWGTFLLTVNLQSMLARAVIVVGVEIFLTGGLHLDGLADTFDGLYSYRDKDKMLEIMKDSRVGTNGVLILIVSILLKVALVASLGESLAVVIILMPAFSRYMGTILAAISKYARPKGMGGFFIGKISWVQITVLTLFTVLIGSMEPWYLVYLPLMMVITLIYRHHVHAKIDGITGDILGAWIEMSELIFLLMVVLI